MKQMSCEKQGNFDLAPIIKVLFTVGGQGGIYIFLVQEKV